MLSLLLALTASGAECETVFSAAELRSVVERAKSAIDDGDPGAHLRASDTLRDRVPCLDEPISTQEWADFLVTEALFKYLEKTPGWEKALKVALKLRPDHPDIQSFILEDYLEPPEPTGDSIAIPAGYVVFVDGKILSGSIPPLDGLHLGQVLHDGVWRSKVLRGQGFPKEWLNASIPEVVTPEPPPPPPKPAQVGGLASWGTVGLTGGLGQWAQAPKSTGSSINSRQASGVSLGLHTQGQQYFARPVGLFWSGQIALQDAAGPVLGGASRRRPIPFGSFFGGLSLFDQPISVWAGVGFDAIRAQEGDIERPFIVSNYLVGLSFRSSGAIPIDASIGGGWIHWGKHLRGEAGATILDIGPVGIRVGARGQLVTARIGDASLSRKEREPLANISQWTGSIFVGFAWGD